MCSTYYGFYGKTDSTPKVTLPATSSAVNVTIGKKLDLDEITLTKQLC